MGPSPALWFPKLAQRFGNPEFGWKLRFPFVAPFPSIAAIVLASRNAYRGAAVAGKQSFGGTAAIPKRFANFGNEGGKALRYFETETEHGGADSLLQISSNEPLRLR